MFKLFGKKQQQTATIKTSVNNNQYPQVVNDIHNEFFTAGDAILLEATTLLKQLETKDLDKGKRLANLGFGKTREALAAIETETKIDTTREIADLVMYYNVNYPNNKFITEDQVKQICEKYGLVYGDVSMYKGFVPEKKLQLIESFKLKEKDIPYAFIVDSWHGDEIVASLNKEDVISNYGHKCIKNNSTFYVVAGTDCNIQHIKNAEKFRYFGNGLGAFENERFLKVISAGSIKMKICAPLKDMEIPQGKQVVGYKITDIPDPVVLQPVKGGYLIVCAWGDEASDEIVINQKLN